MAGSDLSAITAGIQFGSVAVAMLSTFAALVIVLVVYKGALIVLRLVGGGVSVSEYSKGSRSEWDSFLVNIV